MANADQIVDIMVDILEGKGYHLDDVHLIDADTWHGIHNEMYLALTHKDIDLSFMTEYSKKYGLNIGGGCDAIVWEFYQFFTIRSKYGWQETEVSYEDIENANGYYCEDCFRFPEKITKDQFITLIALNKNYSINLGIDSNVSKIDTKIKLSADHKNNLLFSKCTKVYG